MDLNGSIQYRNILDTSAPRLNVDRLICREREEWRPCCRPRRRTPGRTRSSITPAIWTLMKIWRSLCGRFTRPSKISLCEAGRHPRQANLLTVPYVHMCSHCNLQVMGCISSCPAPSEDEMDYEKQVRSVHDRDDSS